MSRDGSPFLISVIPVNDGSGDVEVAATLPRLLEAVLVRDEEEVEVA